MRNDAACVALEIGDHTFGAGTVQPTRHALTAMRSKHDKITGLDIEKIKDRRYRTFLWQLDFGRLSTE